jgi:primosomal protein N' (replication factor Y)
MGPAPAPVARIRHRYRFRLMLRAPERPMLRAALLVIDQALSTGAVPLAGSVRASIDVDPVQLL